MSIEAMKQALEALDIATTPLAKDREEVLRAKAALRRAIKQAQKQKPVAWMRKNEDCTDCIVWEQTEEHTVPLYTAPPQRQPLTDEQIFEVHKKVDSMQYLTFARAIEAAHGIKE